MARLERDAKRNRACSRSQTPTRRTPRGTPRTSRWARGAECRQHRATTSEARARFSDFRADPDEGKKTLSPTPSRARVAGRHERHRDAGGEIAGAGHAVQPARAVLRAQRHLHAQPRTRAEVRPSETRSPIAGADPLDTSNPTPSARINQTDEHRSLPSLSSSPNPLTRRLSRLVSNLVPTHRVCQVEEPR